VKRKRIKCPRCKKSIHIDDFGGIDKEGIFHKNCIVEKLTNCTCRPCMEKKYGEIF